MTHLQHVGANTRASRYTTHVDRPGTCRRAGRVAHDRASRYRQTGRCRLSCEDAAAPPCPRQPRTTPARAICAPCATESCPPRTSVIIQSPRRGRLSACCPHCGLALVDLSHPTDLILVTDFLYGRMISASEATYLIDSEISLCCCPGILAFANLQDAVRFQTRIRWGGHGSHAGARPASAQDVRAGAARALIVAYSQLWPRLQSVGSIELSHGGSDENGSGYRHDRLCTGAGDRTGVHRLRVAPARC